MPDVTAPARATAASGNTPMPGASPAAGPVHVMGVWYKPASAVTGQNTNTRQLRLRNATTPADVATLQLNAGTNLTTGWNRIPLASAPPVLAAINAQTLQWESNAIGTGLADPGGTVKVRWSRTRTLAERTATDHVGRSIITDPELSMDVDVPPEPGEVP
jgi:hypothetical protein